MAQSVFLRKYRDYIILAFLIAVITGGNYVLNGGEKSNWVKASDYGFRFLYPPGVKIWTTGLDDDLVFNPYGDIYADSRREMIGFNEEDKEFAVTWVTFDDEPTLEEILDVHYHSGEVNAIRRDRGFRLETEPVTYGMVNGHESAYQIHLIELDMPDLDVPLYAKGLVVGWTCTETGVSYAAYVLLWRTGAPPTQSDAQIQSSLHRILDTLQCH